MDTKRIIQLIDKGMKFSFDDHNNPALMDKYWNDLASMFKPMTEDEAIEFMYTLDDNQLMIASSVFEELADIYNTDSFWNKLEELHKKRPNVYMDFF